MSKKWTSVTLQGKSQVIPRLCPATLRPASYTLRYGYHGPFYFIQRTTYYQTFNYAEDAGRAVHARLKYVSRMFWVWVLMVVLALASAFAFALASGRPVLGWAGPALGLALGFWLNARFRRSALARHPVPADAVAWGPSAYYTGSGLLGTRAVYKARRPEWIRALVEANPDQIDDATYTAITGKTRPRPDAAKPFA